MGSLRMVPPPGDQQKMTQSRRDRASDLPAAALQATSPASRASHDEVAPLLPGGAPRPLPRDG